ncbi:MAG: bis(5'-nucleosyl)-tetraphosphatase (symmetrical) YqeK [Candidatus Sumerlaeaceae bacterium]|nr:bis(5'-nucleosyl)-tetraphosphatase (symmetrical) YqeK [Candidatus Sumerlaeaceae bacterium]
MKVTAETFSRITNLVESRITPKRFLHTLGVLQTAVELADIHGKDVWRASLAALLHDSSKATNVNEDAKKFALVFGDHPYLETEMPQLLHAPAGAWWAYAELKVDDGEVLDAIAWHPTGHRNPSDTLLILLAADYCEPTRDFPGVDEIRAFVRRDLRGGVKELLRRKLEYVQNTGRPLHPSTQETLLSLEGE